MRSRTRVCLILALAIGAVANSGPANAANASFQSPSHNIVCDLAGGTSNGNRVQCWLMSSKCWNSDAGDFFVYAWGIARNGRAQRFCPSDFVPAQTTLRYGRSVRRGVIRCTSRKTGMRCASLRSGHGFLLSRAKQVRF
jgi:hypothetical protein